MGTHVLGGNSRKNNAIQAETLTVFVACVLKTHSRISLREIAF
ncbi:MAG: hypothetical protein ACI9HK_004782 [Pirellulaceae bacterium]|jgi:hypothetical protein